MLEEVKPFGLLYHGTSLQNITSIEEKGIIPLNYSKVYLTADLQVAYNYAKSKGKPVICVVDAQGLYKDGFKFTHEHDSAEWTVDMVPPKYLVQIIVESETELDSIAYYAHKAVKQYNNC